MVSQIAPTEDSWAVAESEQRLGRLRVLLVRMNTDLTMGRDLLKKTGAANLFTVFGEPDIEIRKLPDGQLVAELHGVDVYDPTTGEIRSDAVDGVACWFIDTDYNSESFFVRHAYFSGAGDPYSRLRQSLGDEINPEAWESLYATVSRPFDAPASGRIAVKVINHHGDDVMKVFDV
jgi:adenine-specific DNA-methyltransferase